jgi:hypothetical protein
LGLVVPDSVHRVTRLRRLADKEREFVKKSDLRRGDGTSKALSRAGHSKRGIIPRNGRNCTPIRVVEVELALKTVFVLSPGEQAWLKTKILAIRWRESNSPEITEI